MNNILHISPNLYPDIRISHATKKIWLELGKGFDQYHILARSQDNRFHTYREGKFFLHLVPKLGKSRSFFFTSLYMLKIIRKYKINLILSQCPMLGGFNATLLSKMMNIPLMVEIHGMEYFRILDSKRVYNRLFAKIIRYSFNNATKVRSLSSKMTRMLIERNVKANIIEIPNRVNLEVFNLPKEDHSLGKTIRIISVGRFVWEKAYDVAIKAVIDLQQRYDIDLTLIGGGPLEEDYKQIIKNNKNIHLVSWVSQEKFVPILTQADIYIQPSISEGMPRTILEAMALRLPVIVSNVGAISGIVNSSKNGLLIEPGNIHSLKQAIESLIVDQDLRETIATNGYNDVISKYEWSKVFDKYRNELLQMVQNENKGSVV
jgi:glycosyltransferase involved in cell wall biosynthesis